MRQIEEKYQRNRDFLVRDIEMAEKEIEKNRALLSVIDRVMEQEDTEEESIETRVKKQYIIMRRVREVGEWAFATIPGFSSTKTGAVSRARDIIAEARCGDDQIDWAADTIFGINSYLASKYLR